MWKFIWYWNACACSCSCERAWMREPPLKMVADDGDRKALEWFIAYVSHEAVKSELNKQYVNISVGLLFVYLLFHFGTLSLPASLARFLTPFNFLPFCSCSLALSLCLSSSFSVLWAFTVFGCEFEAVDCVCLCNGIRGLGWWWR